MPRSTRSSPTNSRRGRRRRTPSVCSATASRRATATPRASAPSSMASPRARAQERHFLEDWLSTSRLPFTVKDKDLHPGYDDARRARFRSELDAFYDDVFARGVTARALFQSNVPASDGTKRKGVLMSEAF